MAEYETKHIYEVRSGVLHTPDGSKIPVVIHDSGTPDNYAIEYRKFEVGLGPFEDSQNYVVDPTKVKEIKPVGAALNGSQKVVISEDGLKGVNSNVFYMRVPEA